STGHPWPDDALARIVRAQPLRAPSRPALHEGARTTQHFALRAKREEAFDVGPPHAAPDTRARAGGDRPLRAPSCPALHEGAQHQKPLLASLEERSAVLFGPPRAAPGVTARAGVERARCARERRQAMDGLS